MGEYAGPGPGPGVASVGVADASSPLIARGIKHQPLNKDPYPALPVSSLYSTALMSSRSF